MITLLERIGERLRSSAYVNEAAITHGIVTPILQHLGWDTADPRQVVPEFANERGRVDFALIGVGQKPGIFIEVKQVGRAMDGDRQLFEYAFHQGVPMCVLTDGREWSFYLPAGQGSYDDRRFYRLQLDERSPAECHALLTRYLDRAAVLDQSAPALHLPLYADLVFLAQCRRRFLRQADQPPPQTRRLPLARRPSGRHQPLPCRPQPKPKALRLDRRS